MGDRRVTTQNLKIHSTDVDAGVILVEGAVPGSKGSYVLVQDAHKSPMPGDAPFPASIRTGGSDDSEVLVADSSEKNSGVVGGAGQQETKLKNDRADDTSTPEKEG
jgi:large subunit ribosomal protein L3